MEAGAKDPEFARAGFIDQRLYRRQCRIAVIRWQHLPETRKETCLFLMQVGDQQRLAFGPEQRALAHDQQILARERNGHHAPAYAAPRVAASQLKRAAWLLPPAHRLRHATRTSAVPGKSVSARVDSCGRRNCSKNDYKS